MLFSLWSAISEKVYYCSNGTNPVGSYCYTTNNQSTKAIKEAIYDCGTYEKTGTGANTKCIIPGNDTIKPIKNVTYDCGDLNKVGTGVNTVCSKTSSTSTVTETKSTKEVIKYKYKWSTETSLAGWTKTGKTRQVTASSK